MTSLEIDESIPPRFLIGIDSILKKVPMGDNWRKYYIYRLSLPVMIIAMTEYAFVKSGNIFYDINVGLLSSFFWTYLLSNWKITRALLAWWTVGFSIGIVVFLIMIIMKLF